MKCPKCGYERKPTDGAPAWQCPSCEAAYAKASRPDKHASHVAADDVADVALVEDHESDERCWLAARGQRIVIYSILLSLVLRGAEQAHVFPDLVMQVLFVCTALYSLWGVVRIGSGLSKPQGTKLLFMALCFFPLINVITLVYLSVRTTRMLRAAGWTVGLPGARP